VSIANSKPTLVAGTGEPTLFDSLARLVPKELQAAYYRVLAHTRTLSPDDEMLRILEAMGILALITRHTPKDIADERERLQELLGDHNQLANEAQQKMLAYVNELEARLSTLPSEVETALNPEQLAKLLGESLRQHFLQSGMPETVSALQANGATMARAQNELSTALHALCDSRGGVIAQVESANRSLTFSLENRARAIDALLQEAKGDILRLWIPLLCGACLLIGLIGGTSVQGWRDSRSAAPTPQRPGTVQSIPALPAQANSEPINRSKRPNRSARKTIASEGGDRGP
jgi:hypothetical protein